MPDFKIHSPYQMAGDQPEAVAKLVEGINNGLTEQTLMGVTGSGKTFTMANIIEQTQRPTLVLAHNKTLAAQLCTELREFFPENAVEYFVSYYDYYQPEAYIASTDTYIEKDSAINDEIDRLRHSATSALSETTRCDHRVVGVVHLLARRPDRLQEHGHFHPSGHGDEPRGAHPPTDRHSVRAQRHCVRAQPLPRAR